MWVQLSAFPSPYVDAEILAVVGGAFRLRFWSCLGCWLECSS